MDDRSQTIEPTKSRYRRILALPLSFNWTSGLMVFVAMLLPFSKDCDGKTRYPVTAYTEVANVGGFLSVNVATAHHWYGLMIAISMATIGWYATQRTIRSVAITNSLIMLSILLVIVLFSLVRFDAIFTSGIAPGESYFRGSAKEFFSGLFFGYLTWS